METRRQVAIIPVRTNAAGGLEVLLITSRETRRWIVPKGWPWPDQPDHQAAAEEAREEAGVLGEPRPAAIGRYTYIKRKPTRLIAVSVDIYVLDVAVVLAEWPEQAERERRWMTPAAAADLISEPELARLLRDPAYFPG